MCPGRTRRRVAEGEELGSNLLHVLHRTRTGQAERGSFQGAAAGPGSPLGPMDQARFPDQVASWPATLTRHRRAKSFPWEGQRRLLAIRPSDEGRQLEHLSPQVLDLLS